MLEVVCVSDVSEEVAICTFVSEVCRVMMQSCYIITYCSVLRDKRRTRVPVATDSSGSSVVSFSATTLSVKQGHYCRRK